MKRTSLVAAAALVIATNAFVLVGVARNRATVSQEIELTDRELMLRKSGEEDSGVSLWLQTVTYFPLEHGWFDQAKLAEAGFDVRMPATDAAAEIRYRHVLPRDVFVVFAYGGPTWEAWVKEQEDRLAAQLGRTPQPSSRGNGTRLIAVDVGRDAATLRRRYPDQAKFLVVRAVVRLVYQKEWDPATRRQLPPTLHGYIDQIVPNEIHVPLPFASELSGASHYSVTLRYGSRYEPWIASIRRM